MASPASGSTYFSTYRILENYVEFPVSEFGVMIRKMPLALRIGVDPFRKYECVAGVNADSLECFSDYFICLSQVS